MFPVYKINVVDKPGPGYGSIEYVLTKPISDPKFYDTLNYDEEVNRLLDEVEEEFLGDYKTENHDISKDTREVSRDKPESYGLPGETRELSRNKLENYDFPEDTNHVGLIPDWYRDMLKNKIEEAKRRLENLSKLVCATSPSTAAHINRIEADHSTAFCKMDYPRHPPMHKSWRSTWEFRYKKNCEETDSNHTHLTNCETLLVVDFKTGLRMDKPNISQHDFPPHVIHVARLFRNFAEELNRKISLSKGKKKPECEDKSECIGKSKCKKKSVGKQRVDAIEDDWWINMTMVLISNQLNELMIVVRRDKVNQLIPHLKEYFPRVIEQNPNIVSVLCFDTGKANKSNKRSLMKAKNDIDKRRELLIAGTTALKDEIGPLTVQYGLTNHLVRFDSVETMQLGKVIQDYMCLTRETTLLDIGSDMGVLSLIMAHKCEKVIKLTAEPAARWLVGEAEKLKKANEIHNVSFFLFNTESIITTCSPLIEQCITVAIVKLKSTRPRLGGPLEDLMKALRNLPSIWRVIICGTFTDQFHESIAELTSEDNSLGERFLPMQGCIVDKSPTVVDAFDLVILFERKSLIAPKVELFAPGPTVNVADSLDAEEVKSEMLLDGDQEIEDLKEKTEKSVPMLTATEKKCQTAANDQSVPLLSVRRKFQYITSSPPSETLRDGKTGQLTNYQFLPAEDLFTSVVIKSEPIDTSYSVDVSETNCFSPTSTVKNELVCEAKVSEVVNTAEDVISGVAIKSEPVDPSYSADLSDDDGTFLEANRYSPMKYVKAEPSLQYEDKKESNVEDCGPTVNAEPSHHKDKNEQNVAHCGTSVKAEPLQDEEKNKPNVADSEISSSIPIKPEPIDQSSSANFPETSCQNTALPVTTKSESTAFSPITSPDYEPMDMQICKYPPDFQSMETPIHNPRALSDITPVTVSKNVSLNGYEFPVQTNQSFLSKDRPTFSVHTNKELGEISDSDDENEAIDKEKKKQQEILETIVPRRHVSTIPVTSKKLICPPRPYPGKYSESSSPHDRRHRRRSPSPKRLKTSPTSENRRRRRSPVSERRRERSKRSPLRGRSRSPRDQHNKRSRSRSPRRR